MILFYSEYCQHCKVLLETIKRHDKNNMIKLVSIDVLRSLKKTIDPKIHSVPALLIVNTKEYLFGKAVFDYLLLPSRGVLFSNQLSKDIKNNGITEKKKTDEIIGEPMAFTLGSISAETFSSIDDTNEILNDKVYTWDTIDNNIQITNGEPLTLSQTTLPSQIPQTPTLNQLEKPETNSDESKKLPSMEEIMKKRSADLSF